MDKIKVLFVCIHNSARSQMAEAFLKKYGGDKFEVESAGIEPGKLNQTVVDVMKEVGIDISKNKTKSVFDFYERGNTYNYVITVCDETNAEMCPVFPSISKKLHWGFFDPSGFTGSIEEKLKGSREVRNQIESKIKDWIKDLNIEVMEEFMTKALVVIDVQNDYFNNGSFPLWDTNNVLKNIENAIRKANDKKIPVILIQHIANSKCGSLFFTEGTNGADIHPRILEISSQAPIIRKGFADSFFNTKLEEALSKLKVTELLICGMMTQNCVTHTAISKSAEKYKVSVLTDCCTTVDEIMHKMALRALSTRITLSTSNDNIF